MNTKPFRAHISIQNSLVNRQSTSSQSSILIADATTFRSRTLSLLGSLMTWWLDVVLIEEAFVACLSSWMFNPEVFACSGMWSLHHAASGQSKYVYFVCLILLCPLLICRKLRVKLVTEEEEGP
jgi:hypothetical protein